MSDSYTEVSRESWFSRLSGAFKGIVVGLILFIAAFPLLFWNEGRAVTTQKSLAEAGRVAVAVSPDRVDPANEGKLLYMSGRAVTDAVLADPVFGVSAPALRLARTVEMYQWEEKTDRKTEEKLGGGTETVTTYSYNKVWSERHISSAGFKRSAEHQNPGSMPYASSEFMAQPVKLGAFTLDAGLISQIRCFDPLAIEAGMSVPEAIRGRGRVYGSGFYVGVDPSSPQVGDLRISFKVVNPTEVSVVACQNSGVLGEYQTKAGRKIGMLSPGSVPLEAMIKRAQDSNRVLTWVLRVAGLVVMMLGIMMILRPLVVIADVVPFVGRIVEFGTGLMAFVIAAAFSLVTIALAWIFYRPVIGIGLLVLAAVLVIVCGQKIKARQAARP